MNFGVFLHPLYCPYSGRVQERQKAGKGCVVSSSSSSSSSSPYSGRVPERQKAGKGWVVSLSYTAVGT